MMEFEKFIRDFLDKWEEDFHRKDMRSRLVRGTPNDFQLAQYIWDGNDHVRNEERRRTVQQQLALALNRSLSAYPDSEVKTAACTVLVAQLEKAGSGPEGASGNEWLLDWLGVQLHRMRKIEFHQEFDHNIPQCDICLIVYAVRTWRRKHTAGDGGWESKFDIDMERIEEAAFSMSNFKLKHDPFPAAAYSR